MAHIQPRYRTDGSVRYCVRWRDANHAEHYKSFNSRTEAEQFLNIPSVTHRVDWAMLYLSLDMVREQRRMSWPDVAKAVGCTPDVFTRMSGQFGCDTDTFVSLLAWLGVPTVYAKESR